MCALKDFWNQLILAYPIFCLDIVQGFYCAINQILALDGVIKGDREAFCNIANFSKISVTELV